MKWLITTLLIIAGISTQVSAQDYALFIHGFEGSGESWISSGTPSDWVNAGVIDDYVVISYQTGELATPAGQAAVIQRIATEMALKDPAATGRWVLVGHSMGGLVARAGYHSLKTTPSTQMYNILGVLTVGAPHQGARASHVSIGPEQGYINVEYTLNDFEQTIREPLNSVHPSVNDFVAQYAPNALDQIDKAPDLLRTARSRIEFFEEASVNNNVKDIIGLNGSLIQEINSGQLLEPTHKRSVIGTEKEFVLVRTANEIIPPRTGDEYATLENFDQIRLFISVNGTLWHGQQVIDDISLDFAAAKESRRIRDRWVDAGARLDRIDGFWGVMIDSYINMPVDVSGWVYICEISDPDQLPADDGQGGDCWEWQTTQMMLPVLTKNDVIVGPDYAVWNPGESPNDQSKNWYYDDMTADGGYNHFELRRYKRAYTLPGVFQAGQVALPMGEAKNWLEIVVFQ